VSKRFRRQNHAVGAVAATGRLFGHEGRLHRVWLLGRAEPSSVVIAWPAACSTDVMQERTGVPSISTVQVPH